MRSPTPFALLLAPCLVFGAEVSADVVHAACAADGSSFRYRITRMPDFTQRREAFPNTGAMYCIPTSTMNLFAYAAKHGYPGTSPGIAHWQGQGTYDQATDAIAQMATIMDTTPTGGTTAEGSVVGLSDWAEDDGNYAWKVRLRTAAFPIQLVDLVEAACAGWIVAVTRGEYMVTGSYQGYPLLTHAGGHGITMTEARLDAKEQLFAYRNPDGDPTDLTGQPAFANTVVDFSTVTVAFGTTDADIVTVTALAYTPGDTTMLTVDALRVLRPTYGIVFEPAATPTGGTLRIVDPAPFEGSIDLFLDSIAIADDTTLLDVALHPDFRQAFVLTQSGSAPSELQTLDLFTGALGATSAPTGLARFCVSRNDQLYAIGGIGGTASPDTLYLLALDGTTLASIDGLPVGTAVAYDDDRDEAVWFSVASAELRRFSGDLSSTVLQYAIPGSIALSGDGDVAVNHLDSSMWFCSEGSDDLFFTTVPGPPFTTTTVSLGTIAGPRALDSDAFGRMLVSCDSGLRVVAEGAASGLWLVDFASPFDQLAAGPRIDIVDSASNYDPTLHSVEQGWYDIPADDLRDVGVLVPDCVADLNADGSVDSADLGLLVSEWGTPGIGAGYSDADLDGDGTVGGGDLGLLLGAWGACP